MGVELVLMLRPCRDSWLNVSEAGLVCGNKGGSVGLLEGVGEDVRSKLGRGREGRQLGLSKIKSENKLRSNYSCCQILIVEVA